MGFKGTFTIGLLDFRHVLIRFELEDDILRCWLKGLWSFQGYSMLVLKWTPAFSVAAEMSIVPVWLSLPNLPIHFFAKGPLFSIALLPSELLKVDTVIVTLIRPSVARFCVELDLLQEIPEKIWIGNGSGDGFWQVIEYENLPFYCTSCNQIGHNVPSYRYGQRVSDDREQKTQTQNKE